MTRTLSTIALTLALLGTASVAQAADTFLTLRASTPLIASAGGGLRLGSPDGSMRPTIQGEAGIGGGRISLGLDNTGEGAWGYGVKASILRTWIEAIDVDEDQTFLGVDLDLSIRQLFFSLGGYRRISNGDDDWMVSAGIGFIF